MNPLYLSDFNYYWLAGKVALAGGNPFDVNQMQSMSLLLLGEEVASWQFNYPPHTFWLFILFAMLPLPMAKVLWGLCLVASISTCIGFLYQASRAHTNQINPRVVLYSYLLFTPIWDELSWGQCNWICLIGVTALVYAIEAKRHYTAGMALSLTLFKPHLFIPLHLIILASKNIPCRLVIIGSAPAGVLAQLLLSGLAAPELFGNFASSIAHLASNSSNVRAGTTVSIAQLALHFDRDARQLISVATLLLAIAFALLIARSRNTTIRDGLAAAIPTGVLLAPHAYPHAVLASLVSHQTIVASSRLQGTFGKLYLTLIVSSGISYVISALFEPNLKVQFFIAGLLQLILIIQIFLP